MATKKQKREAGELKAKREAEERRQSGLAAQKRAREAEAKRHETSTDIAKEMNQKHRSTLLKKGINPSTGLIFSDYDMAEMEKKANTSERRHLLEKIRAGRAGLLNEQPPVGGVDDYIDRDLDLTTSLYADVGIPAEMTVGEFRDRMDQAWTDWTTKKRNEVPAYTPNQIYAMAKKRGEVPPQTPKEIYEASRRASQNRSIEDRVVGELPAGDATSDYTKRDDRFSARFMETQTALRKFTGSGDQ